jgi:hypothetical protein
MDLHKLFRVMHTITEPDLSSPRRSRSIDRHDCRSRGPAVAFYGQVGGSVAQGPSNNRTSTLRNGPYVQNGAWSPPRGILPLRRGPYDLGCWQPQCYDLLPPLAHNQQVVRGIARNDYGDFNAWPPAPLAESVLPSVGPHENGNAEPPNDGGEAMPPSRPTTRTSLDYDFAEGRRVPVPRRSASLERLYGDVLQPLPCRDEAEVRQSAHPAEPCRSSSRRGQDEAIEARVCEVGRQLAHDVLDIVALVDQRANERARARYEASSPTFQARRRGESDAARGAPRR